MGPRVLIDMLVAVAERAAEVDLRTFEEGDLEDLREILVPAVLEVVKEGRVAMDRVLESYDLPSGREESGEEIPAGNFYASIDQTVGRAVEEESSIHVADLAFMGRMELRDRQDALETLDPSADRWRVLTVCDGCVRRLRKAAAAVEMAIASSVGAEPRLRYVTELNLSRLIRGYYARFRREIEGKGVPTAETVHARLLSAATSIAKLIGRDFYGDLRVSDRAELRSLQARLRSWLRGEDGYESEAGLRVWRDLQCFAVLLSQVNRRSELVEGDRLLIDRALSELAAVEDEKGEVPAALLESLQGLAGRSEFLDELLAEPVTRDRGPWLAELQRLRDSLQVMSGADESDSAAEVIEW